MKYLWVSLFENPKGRIPIFVELRRLNEQSNDRLDLYIYHSIIDSQSALSEAEFGNGIASGRFVLVLDGFDELDERKRDVVEKEILALAHNNPGLTVIVSSRADERFAAWQSFSVFHVLPLSKDQVVELIQKMNYDRITKKKFVERIKKDLYQKHTSFLSNPLLATMMLLTFDQFADIPEKIHLFYEQAFDTLFAKHDATKEAYKRKMHSRMPIDNFKRVFAYFCLATYYDEKFDFSETDSLEYLRKALAIENRSADAEGYLKDLLESVCMLQRDGIKLVFSHRSFQEYFAAYCLSRVSSAHISAILPKIARRPTDKVIKMLHDMDGALLEKNFILPNLRAIVADLASFPDSGFLIHYCQYMSSEIRIHKEREGLAFSHSRSSDRGAFVQTVRDLYRSMRTPGPPFNEFSARDNRILSKHAPASIAEGRGVGVIKFDGGVAKVRWDQQESNKRGEWLPAPWFAQTGYAAWCKQEADLLKLVLEQIQKDEGVKRVAFDHLLGLSGARSSPSP